MEQAENGLFEAKGVHGVHSGRPLGRIDAERNTHKNREYDGNNRPGHGQVEWEVDQLGDQESEQRSRDRSEHSAYPRQRPGFDEKLEENVPLVGSDRHAHSDFSRALGDRYQHDVHHADPADEQPYGRDDREHDPYGYGNAPYQTDERLACHCDEVVVFPGPNATTGSEEMGDFFDSILELITGSHVGRNRNKIRFTLEVFAKRRLRDDEEVIRERACDVVPRFESNQ